MKTIGIIGGLGPMATVYFMELITRMTDAATDQKHPRILLSSIPDTPDRTAYILDNHQQNPLPYLISAGKNLEHIGADFIAIPCVTAHFFYHELSAALQIPVISLYQHIVDEFMKNNIDCVGLLSTNGTIQSGILTQYFSNHGIKIITPASNEQAQVMEIIYGQIKQGTSVSKTQLEPIALHLKKQGVQKILLGCTELSLLKKDLLLSHLYVDALEILAQKTVLFSGAKLKNEYENIIIK